MKETLPPAEPAPSRIVGGPVCTRTADRSLHVSFSPSAERSCNFDCVYCPFPRTKGFRHWPKHGDVRSAVAQALRDAPEIESITISGAGEPTLHPRFGMALADVLSARAGRPELPVRVVTNGTTLVEPRVRRLLEFADELVVRIDADAERVDRPRSGPSRVQIAAALHDVDAFSVESFFVEGAHANTGARAVEEWAEQVAELAPRRVWVTTVSGAPLDAQVRPANAETLERIAATLRGRFDGEVVVLG